MITLNLFIGEEVPTTYTGVVCFEAKGLTANRKEWYLNGKLHREDGPAVVHDGGKEAWYLNGLLHRVDGPAVIRANGTKTWYLNGEIHREDGPAIVNASGIKTWFLNGKFHREDGPAIVHKDGQTMWFLHGERVTQKQSGCYSQLKKLGYPEVACLWVAKQNIERL